MSSFFYVEGDAEAQRHADRVIAECSSFLSTANLVNRAWVVNQASNGELDVGLNLDGNGTESFQTDALRVLEFLRGLATELNVSFIAGTDGEDRVVIDPRSNDDLATHAAFLNA